MHAILPIEVFSLDFDIIQAIATLPLAIPPGCFLLPGAHRCEMAAQKSRNCVDEINELCMRPTSLFFFFFLPTAEYAVFPARIVGA